MPYEASEAWISDSSGSIKSPIRGFYFDASFSNKIYGSSSHVTPCSLTLKTWLRVS